MWQLWAVYLIASAAITLIQTILVMVAWEYIAAAIGAKPLGFWGALMVTVAVQALKLKIDFKA